MSTTKDRPRMIIPTVSVPHGKRPRAERERIAKQLAELRIAANRMPPNEAKADTTREAPSCPLADRIRLLSVTVRALECRRNHEDVLGFTRRFFAQILDFQIKLMFQTVFDWTDKETGS